MRICRKGMERRFINYLEAKGEAMKLMGNVVAMRGRQLVRPGCEPCPRHEASVSPAWYPSMQCEVCGGSETLGALFLSDVLSLMNKHQIAISTLYIIQLLH